MRHPLSVGFRREKFEEFEKRQIPGDLFLEGESRSLFKKQSSIFEVVSGRLLSIIQDYLPRGERSFSYLESLPTEWLGLLERMVADKIIEPGYQVFRNIRTDKPKIWYSDLPLILCRGKDQPVSVSGVGYSNNPPDAISMSIGEALERYFLALPPTESLIRGSPDFIEKSGLAAVDVTKLPGFLPFQKKIFPYLGLDKDDEIHWLYGRSFSRNKKVLLPTQLIFWMFDNSSKLTREKLFHPKTSSGGAGFFNLDTALLKAVLELVQRDAFFIYWLNHLSPKVITVDGLAGTKIENNISYLERYGYRAILMDGTTDIGIPTCFAVVIDELDKSQIVLGASSDFSPSIAVEQALLEAMASLNRFQEKFFLPANYRPFMEPSIGRKERLSLWWGDKMLQELNFFLSGERISFTDFSENSTVPRDSKDGLHRVLSSLKKSLGNDTDIFYYEAKSKILSDFGFHVVKAIIPGLMPLYLNEHYATLNCSRLREVPLKLGYRPASRFYGVPHLFP